MEAVVPCAEVIMVTVNWFPLHFDSIENCSLIHRLVKIEGDAPAIATTLKIIQFKWEQSLIFSI